MVLDFLDEILQPDSCEEISGPPKNILAVGQPCKTSDELTALARFVEAHRIIVSFVEEDGSAQTVR